MRLRMLGLCVLLAAISSGCAKKPAPDLVLFNGKIVTADRNFRIADGIAVTGDRITEVGAAMDVLRLAGPGTQRIDLQGRTVLPGLIDSHSHAAAAALYEFDHTVPDMETIDDVLSYIKGRAESLKEGEWVSVSQVFITRLKDQRYPTRAELDRVAPKNPVAFRTGPDASLNSLALKLCGIDKNFKPGTGEPCRIEHDPGTGEPTGIMRSCAGYLKFRTSDRVPTTDDRRNRLKTLLADYNSVGITGLVEGDAEDEEVEIYKQLKERGELTCRAFLAVHVDSNQPIEKIEERIRQTAANPLHHYDNMLWLRGIKTYLDGGMLTGSAYMGQPWGVSRVYSIDDPSYRGMRFIEPEKLYRMAKAALKDDFQFTAHSVGDGAVATLVDAYERIDKELPVRDRRPNITHANFITPETIQKMKALGVVANMQPVWLYMDGATLLKHFGPERLSIFQPYRTLQQNGVIVGGGSDHMQKIGSLRSINPYNPFLGIWTAVTRKPRWMQGSLHPEQSLTRAQAITLYTMNNAWLTFEEKEKGSLEPGKLADFIVIDKDILTCPEDDIKTIEVQRTYLGGKPVFTRAGLNREDADAGGRRRR